MKKSTLFASFIRLLFADRRALLKALYHFTASRDARRRVLKKYDLPEGLPSLDLLDLFPDFDETIDNYTYLDGTSRPIDIALIKALCKQPDSCSYLEIGSWRGESLSNAADVCAECCSISLSDTEMKAKGFEKEIPFQRLFTAGRPNIHHFAQSSLTFKFDSLGKRFDVIFIDGDHSYDAVKSDTENAFRLLKDEASVIVWHDYGAELPEWPVLAGILDGSPPEARAHIYSVTNTLCAIYTRQQVPSMILSSPQTPSKTFRIRMVAAPFPTR
jgi:hypothetical protein